MTEEIADLLRVCKNNDIIIESRLPNARSRMRMALKNKMSERNLKLQDYIHGEITIFLSYTRNDKDFADVLDETLQSYGYCVCRDVRGIDDWANIEKFMRKIKNLDYVVPLVSDEYLHKKDCIYEISLLITKESYKEKTLPVIIDRIKPDMKRSFFDIKHINEIVRYWSDYSSEIEQEQSYMTEEEKFALGERNVDIGGFAVSVSNFLGFASNIKDKVIIVQEEDEFSEKLKLKTKHIADCIDEYIQKKLE